MSFLKQSVVMNKPCRTQWHFKTHCETLYTILRNGFNEALNSWHSPCGFLCQIGAGNYACIWCGLITMKTEVHLGVILFQCEESKAFFFYQNKMDCWGKLSFNFLTWLDYEVTYIYFQVKVSWTHWTFENIPTAKNSKMFLVLSIDNFFFMDKFYNQKFGLRQNH